MCNANSFFVFGCSKRLAEMDSAIPDVRDLNAPIAFINQFPPSPPALQQPPRDDEIYDPPSDPPKPPDNDSPNVSTDGKLIINENKPDTPQSKNSK